MATNKNSKSSDLSKIILATFTILGLLIGLLLGTSFVSLLLITLLLIFGIFYVRTEEQYSNIIIGNNSIKFLSSVNSLLFWIIGIMINTLIM
ncbi:MAG: hypothetical protein ACJ0DE_02100 [Dehalococcoidia bacterium]|jgi:hypothetical protein|tara:strand:- start:243 stop:518 length:276 start_codon:yes stop_codon:yes gene_type:complete